jgi:predicted ATPase
LFGRAEELALLLRRWEQARSGSGKVILISGEPGIGKSRLTREFRGRISEDECSPLVFSCAPHRQHSAYYPIAEYLERAAGFRHTDNDTSRWEKLQTLLQRSGTIPDDIALLVDLLSLKTTASVPDLTPRRRRELTMEALVGPMVSAGKHRPALTVFEDVHWIDPTSREVLDRLIDRIADLPMLLIVTYRPEFVPPWSTWPHVTTVVLNALDRSAAADMVERIAGGVMAETACRQIVDRADGVPLFIEEVTRAALEVSGDAVPKTPSQASAVVPATLKGSLTARLDRLGAIAREVAQAGAAIGREFSHDLLAAIAGLHEDALGSALRLLEDAELVDRRGVAPDAMYSFRHVLLRDAAYGTLLRGARRGLHARIVEAIVRLRPEAAQREPQLLALHYTGAGLAEPAIGYWRRAGERSVEQFANQEAVGYFERALELVAALPPGRGAGSI